MKEGYYFFDVSNVRRSQGHSVVAAVAYRMAEKLYDERTGEYHDFTRKQGVVLSIDLVPHSVFCAPTTHELWNDAEYAEVKGIAVVGREYVLAVPDGLNEQQRIELMSEFSRHVVEKFRVVATASLHEPGRQSDDRNHHIHLMTSTRIMNDDGAFGEKTRYLDCKSTSSHEIKELRKEWAEMANKHLERAGIDVYIDHRSLYDRNIDRMPGIDIGRNAWNAERKGIKTELGDKLREIQRLNEENEAEKAKLIAERAQQAELKNAINEAHVDTLIDNAEYDRQSDIKKTLVPAKGSYFAFVFNNKRRIGIMGENNKYEVAHEYKKTPTLYTFDPEKIKGYEIVNKSDFDAVRDQRKQAISDKIKARKTVAPIRAVDSAVVAAEEARAADSERKAEADRVAAEEERQRAEVLAAAEAAAAETERQRKAEAAATAAKVAAMEARGEKLTIDDLSFYELGQRSSIDYRQFEELIKENMQHKQSEPKYFGRKKWQERSEELNKEINKYMRLTLLGEFGDFATDPQKILTAIVARAEVIEAAKAAKVAAEAERQRAEVKAEEKQQQERAAAEAEVAARKAKITEKLQTDAKTEAVKQLLRCGVSKSNVKVWYTQHDTHYSGTIIGCTEYAYILRSAQIPNAAYIVWRSDMANTDITITRTINENLHSGKDTAIGFDLDTKGKITNAKIKKSGTGGGQSISRDGQGR